MSMLSQRSFRVYKFECYKCLWYTSFPMSSLITILLICPSNCDRDCKLAIDVARFSIHLLLNQLSSSYINNKIWTGVNIIVCWAQTQGFLTSFKNLKSTNTFTNSFTKPKDIYEVILCKKKKNISKIIAK